MSEATSDGNVSGSSTGAGMDTAHHTCPDVTGCSTTELLCNKKNSLGLKKVSEIIIFCYTNKDQNSKGLKAKSLTLHTGSSSGPVSWQSSGFPITGGLGGNGICVVLPKVGLNVKMTEVRVPSSVLMVVLSSVAGRRVGVIMEDDKNMVVAVVVLCG